MTTAPSPTTSASARITATVGDWPGVHHGLGERGELSFRLGRREIGHLHGDRVAHFGFPKEVGAALRAAGRVGPHPVAPHKPAWAARALTTAADVDDVIALMRLNYDRVVAKHGLPDGDPV
ncbi:luciferase domain-containing protein [Patulibacter defluvii]|uniref:luciferase domain-containing protein n=1 Tax=Patulibacter defluvii TaxID=3095358 RepID=UPI002A74ED9C|nr:luciferase family protein [Patulibacter sp. DM4]